MRAQHRGRSVSTGQPPTLQEAMSRPKGRAPQCWMSSRISERAAKPPATASRFQGMRGAGMASCACVVPSSSRAPMSSPSRAAVMAGRAAGSCRTRTWRCIRSISRPSRPGRPSRALRMRRSSVGQSMPLTAKTAVAPSAASSGSGVMSMAFRAASMDAVDGSSCSTVSTRCMRLKVRPVMPGTVASFFLMSASSMGQSMLRMRYTARVAEGAASVLQSTAWGASWPQQQEPCSCAWSWSQLSWSCAWQLSAWACGWSPCPWS